MDFSIDPVSAFIAIIGIVLPIVFTIYWQRKKDQKALSYSIVTQSELLDLNESALEGFELSLNNEAMYTLHQITVRIENSGNSVIEKDDYERSIKIEFSLSFSGYDDLNNHRQKSNIITFSDKYPILSATSTEKSSPAIPVEIAIINIDYMNGYISIAPMLLNPQDWFIVQIISSYELEMKEINARISGVKEIEQTKISRRFFQGATKMITLNYIYIVIFIVLLALTSSSPIEIIKELFDMSILFVICMIAYFFQWKLLEE